MNILHKTLPMAIAGALAVLAAPEAFAQAAAAAPAAKAAAPAKGQSKQRTFASPEEAAGALVDAVKARDRDGLLAIVGPGSGEWLFSGDSVADANDWKRFLAAYEQKHT